MHTNSGSWSRAIRVVAIGFAIAWVAGAAHAKPQFAVTDIGTLGGASSVANAVNRSGAVAGSSTLSGNAQIHAFVMRKGVMIDIGTLGGNRSEGLAINRAGNVAGNASPRATPRLTPSSI